MKKILLLSANPKNTDKLRLDEEVREIQTALRRAKNRSEFEIVTELALRVDDLHRVLLDQQPTIVHFSGHGAGSHGLVLENNSGQKLLSSLKKPQRAILALLAALGANIALGAQPIASLTKLSVVDSLLETLLKRNLIEANGARYSIATSLVEELQQHSDVTYWMERTATYFTN